MRPPPPMEPIDEFGWTFLNPDRPHTECRWCPATNIVWHGLTLCPACDLLPMSQRSL